MVNNLLCIIIRRISSLSRTLSRIHIFTDFSVLDLVQTDRSSSFLTAEERTVSSESEHVFTYPGSRPVIFLMESSTDFSPLLASSNSLFKQLKTLAIPAIIEKVKIADDQQEARLPSATTNRESTSPFSRMRSKLDENFVLAFFLVFYSKPLRVYVDRRPKINRDNFFVARTELNLILNQLLIFTIN